MLTNTEDVAIIILCVGLSLAFLWGLRWLWPSAGTADTERHYRMANQRYRDDVRGDYRVHAVCGVDDFSGGRNQRG